MKASEGRFDSFFVKIKQIEVFTVKEQQSWNNVRECQRQREAGGRGFVTVESLCAPTPRHILELELNSPF